MHDAETGTGRHRFGRGRLPRWILPAAVVAVVASAATALLIVRTAGAACAAGPEPGGVPPVAAGHALGRGPLVATGLPAPGQSRGGRATFYGADGGGNCSFEATGPGLYVALGPAEYAAGAACGGYLDVTGPKGTVRVKVTDQCPECEAGHLDLSREAFARIGATGDGVIAVTYRSVRDPQLPAPLTVRVKDGASRYWLALRVDNHGNPLASVEVRSGAAWTALTRTDYNYWIKEDGAGPGPYSLRVTDTAGHAVILPGIAMTPTAVQRTSVAMYGGTATAPSAAPSPSPSSPPASPTASTSASGSALAAAISPGGASPSGAAPPGRRRCR